MGEEFVGREMELAELESLYNSKRGPRTCAVYGRRRVGKTSLLRKFCESKRHLFFTMNEGSEIQNLEHIERAVSSAVGSKKKYDNFSHFIYDLADICKDEKTVIVLDELPLLLHSAPYIAGLLQHFIDHLLGDSMLIICGSSISSMEAEMNDASRPLYGRFRVRLRIRQMCYRECIPFHEDMSEADKLRIYLAVGGVPYYHIDDGIGSFKDFVKKRYLSTNSFLQDEVRNLVYGMRDPWSCMAVLEAIASGADRLTPLADRTGIDKSTCKRIISELTFAGMVDTMTPMCGSPKHPRYYISDNLVRFDRQVVNKHPFDPSESPEERYRALKDYIDTYMGRAFEDLCLSFVKENYNCRKAGRCWGRFEFIDGSSSTDADIDVVAYIRGASGTDYSLFGECKFTGHPMRLDDLRTLKRRVDSLRLEQGNIHYALFSLSGFSPELMEMAEDDGILLFDPDVLASKKPIPTLP